VVLYAGLRRGLPKRSAPAGHRRFLACSLRASDQTPGRVTVKVAFFRSAFAAMRRHLTRIFYVPANFPENFLESGIPVHRMGC